MPRLHTAPDVMKAAFIQDTDPVNNTTAQITALGAVTAGKIWIDTTGGGWVWKRRSADNLSWITRAESAAAAAAWGAITGTIGTQTDLQNEFNKRVSVNSLGTANGIATLDAGGKVPPLQLPAQTADTFDHSTLQAKIERGAANGYAPLGADLKVPAANLPAQTSGGTTSVTGGNLVATSGYASLEAAFAAINATAAPLTTLMVNSVIPLVGSTVATLVQPANITLYFVGGGRVNRTTATRLTELQFNCDDPYQICFSGFAVNDLKFGLKLPPTISPCHFGAVAELLGDDPSKLTVGAFDTLPAVKLIEAAFTRTYGAETDNSIGSVIAFPAGDFWFSDEWVVGKNFGARGVESNTGQFHSTRLWFKKNRSGLVLRNIPTVGSSLSQPWGNKISHLLITQDQRDFTNSTVNVTGSRTFVDADINLNQITVTGHPFLTGQRVQLSSSEAATPLSTDGIYYIIKIDANTVKLAVADGNTAIWERQNAYNGTAINIPRTGVSTAVFTLSVMELVWVGGSAVQTTTFPHHYEDKPFAYPLNDGSVIKTTDGHGLALTVFRQRKALSVAAALKGATTLTLATGSATTFTADDVDAELTMGAFFKTVIIGVAGQTVTLRDPLNFDINVQGVFIISGRRVDVAKPDFMMYVYPGIDQIGGLMTKNNVGGMAGVGVVNLILDQRIKFISPNGVANDYKGKITEILSASAVRVSPFIPTAFGGSQGVLQYGQVQSLKTTTNLKVQLVKHAGILVEDANASTIENVSVRDFGGDGIAISTDPHLQIRGNSNTVTARNCFLTFNNGCGLRTIGKESNGAYYENINSVYNGGHGIFENSHIGSTIVSGHLADNRAGSLYSGHNSFIALSDKGTTRTTIIGVYAEGGQVGYNLGESTILTGGVNDIGFHPESRHAHSLITGDPQGAILGGRGILMITRQMKAKLKGTPNNATDNHFLTAGGGANQYTNASDWGIGTGDFGDRGYIGSAGGTEPTAGRWILAWDFLKRIVKTRGELQIGDGSGDPNLYSGMISGTAPPTTGSYPQGYVVLNRGAVSGGKAGWVNVGNLTTAKWETFGTISGTATTALAFTSTSPLPNATVGTTYTHQLAATGGTTPYTFAFIAGAFAGSFTAAGLITADGTNAAGTRSLTFRVTDAAGVAVDKVFSLTFV